MTIERTTPSNEPVGGLTLQEAWEPWRDPELYDKHREAAALSPTVGFIGDPEFFLRRRRAHVAWTAVLSAFKGRFRKGELVAVGREGAFSAPLAVIPAEAWRGGKLHFGKNTVTTGDGATHYDVRVLTQTEFDAWRTRKARHQQEVAPDMATLPQKAPPDGTPLDIAEYFHAARELLEAFRQAMDAWETKGRPTTRRVGRFRIHESVHPANRFGRDEPDVTVQDETWQAVRRAEATLLSSFHQRLLEGKCVLHGFREDTEQTASIPPELIPTLKISKRERLATTAGSRTYHNVVVFELADYKRRLSGDGTLKGRVIDALCELAAAGKLDADRGGQAKAIGEIGEHLGIERAQLDTVKTYVSQVWKSELKRSLAMKAERDRQ